MISESKRSIFREEALEYYALNKEKDVLPRIIAPPVFLLLWMLCGLCVVALIGAWFSSVPVYVSGSGAVLGESSIPGTQAGYKIIALLFLPVHSGRPLPIHAGTPVRLQIDVGGQRVITTAIHRVESGVLSPDDARKRYGLGNSASQIIKGPSIAVSIQLDKSFQMYVGSTIYAQVQTGSKKVLSLLPVFGTLIGE